MTISTPSPIPERAALRQAGRPARRAGFTLVEVLIGAALSTVILAAVLSTFLFMARSGANLSNYSDMEAQARKSLEYFAEDVRQASAITWNSATSVTLAVNSVAVNYYYDSGTGTFHRASLGTNQTLITGIASGSFTFKAFNVAGTEMPLTSAAELTAAGSSTKQLQISLEAVRATQTVASASNLVLSARYILRNKIVTA